MAKQSSKHAHTEYSSNKFGNNPNKHQNPSLSRVASRKTKSKGKKKTVEEPESSDNNNEYQHDKLSSGKQVVPKKFNTRSKRKSIENVEMGDTAMQDIEEVVPVAQKKTRKSTKKK